MKTKHVIRREREFSALLRLLVRTNNRYYAAINTLEKEFGTNCWWEQEKQTGLWRKRVAAINHWNKKHRRIWDALVPLFVEIKQEDPTTHLHLGRAIVEDGLR